MRIPLAARSVCSDADTFTRDNNSVDGSASVMGEWALQISIKLPIYSIYSVKFICYASCAVHPPCSFVADAAFQRKKISCSTLDTCRHTPADKSLPLAPPPPPYNADIAAQRKKISSGTLNTLIRWASTTTTAAMTPRNTKSPAPSQPTTPRGGAGGGRANQQQQQGVSSDVVGLLELFAGGRH